VQAVFAPRQLPPARQLALLDASLAALGVD
jgi:hypothetical protein